VRKSGSGGRIFKNFGDPPCFCAYVIDFIGEVNPLSMYNPPVFLRGSG